MTRSAPITVVIKELPGRNAALAGLDPSMDGGDAGAISMLDILGMLGGRALGCVLAGLSLSDFRS